MKITNTCSVIIFAISPFLSGVAFNWIMYFLTIKATNPFPYPLYFGAGLGWAALFFFFIPATIVGVIYIKNTHLSNFKQESICTLSGFAICALCLSPSISGSGYGPAILFGVIGAITAFTVARLLNYLKNKEQKLS